MDTILYALSMLFALVGLVGTIVPRFPSLAFSLAALSLLFAEGGQSPITISDWFIMAGISLCATLSARFLSPIITKRWGGTRHGYWGAVIGMFAGFMLYPPVGVVLSPLFGAVLGEMLYDKSSVVEAYKRGFFSFCSFMVGVWLCFVVALWVLWLLVNTTLPILISRCEVLFS